MLANSWLEGSYSETYPDVSRDAEGMARLFRQFSFPGGVPSHVAPETPGSIHEGGELGYSLAHAYGAALDNPGPAGRLRDRRRRGGDRAAGRLLALQQVPRPGPRRRRPADPAPQRLQDRQPDRARPALPEAELDELLRGYGHEPIHVTGDDPATVHRAMAAAMDKALDRIAADPARRPRGRRRRARRAGR